jgi:protein-disulfide isomerase
MSRFMKVIAVAALIPALSIATAAYAAMTDAQTKEIQAVVGSYLKSNPQVIITALQEYQRQQMQAADQTIKNTQKDAAQFSPDLFRSAKDPVGGNPKGTVTVVEFFDYQCPHCVDMAPVLSDVIKSDPNVRIVFKEFPIRGPLSDFASRAALAANMQGKYMPFHDELMKTPQPYTQESIMKAAQTAGLNIDQLKKDMDGEAVKSQIKANMKLGQDLKLLGTPAFFIGKTDATSTSTINYVPGHMDLKQLQEVIKKNS